jgi:AcrR family transcriptional regulator
MAQPTDGDAAMVRRRPRDRRERILASAARQFWEQGYQQVAMADIGSAVGIGASALYRHFRGKADLLAAVLDETVGHLEQAVSVAPDLDGQLTSVAEAALRHREFAVLWDRESGHLPEPERARLRDRRRAVVDRVARSVSPRPGAELRTRAVVAVLESVSYHRVEIEHGEFVQLLRQVCQAVLAAPLAETVARIGPSGGQPQLPVSRREALLAAASRLFAERGFPSVSLGDVGAATGIAGPSVYNHFDSKAELLLSILNRGNEVLWFGLHRALDTADGPADALERVLDSYVNAFTSDPSLVSVLLTEIANLPAEQRERFHRVQHDYVVEWVALLRRWRPELTEPTARILVHAALGVANSLAGTRASALPERPAPHTGIVALASAVLHTGRPVSEP